MLRVSCRLRQIADRRVEEIIGKRDSIAACDFHDLVLAVTIESRPLDTVTAFIAPVEFDAFPFVPNEQPTSYGGIC